MNEPIQSAGFTQSTKGTIMKPRLVVSAGPTREWIDPVRFLSNPSTGQTGWEIAAYARKSGAFSEVVLISGPGRHAFRELSGVQNIDVETTEDMARAVQGAISDDCLLIMTAAPADYKPAICLSEKKKKKAGQTLTLELVPTTDILKSLIPLAKDLKHFYRVGFAAETTNIEDYARRKLTEKELDFICANRVFKGESGFGGHSNTLYVLGKDQSRHVIGPYPKKLIAEKLVSYLLEKIFHRRGLFGSTNFTGNGHPRGASASAQALLPEL